MAFELWETATGNIIGTYETADDALNVVRSAVAASGRACTETWALTYEDKRGRTKLLAQGAELAQRAFMLSPPDASTQSIHWGRRVRYR